MADGITELFNKKPTSGNYIKKVVILTANDFETISIEESYVKKEI